MAVTEEALQIHESDIDAYIEHLRELGRSHVTIRKSNRVLHKIYRFLPEDRRLHRGDFERIMMNQLEQYSVSTVNSAISAFNGLMKFLDHREYCVEQLHMARETEPQELTNADYNKLLLAARQAGLRSGYLLVKLFANTTIGVRDMPFLTVEAAREGIVYPEGEDPVLLPPVIRKELLDYAEEKGIVTGAIIANSQGTPLHRVMVDAEIGKVWRAAGYEQGVVTPRSLQKLYARRRESIYQQFEPLIEQSYNNMMDTEQTLFGWAPH